VGRPPQTATNEIKNRRVDSSKGFKETNSTNARADNNPYRLIPRTKVFYCDPCCATQKSHAERNHEELRRIQLKGTGFNSLD
jgi:hypothetical protein